MTMSMDDYMVMLMVNINEAKAHLSEYINRLETESEIVVCRRNKPVAVLRPVSDSRSQRRIGGEKGSFKIPESFFEPLPAEIQSGFDGDAG